MKVKVHNNTVIHPSHAVCLVTPESSFDSSAHVEWEVRSGTTVFFMSLILALPFLYCVFLEPCICFFPGCKLWRGASLSSLTLATQDLTKLRENKIPAFHCMNWSPAASPLGEAQQWLHFKKWADWKRLLTGNCPRSFRGSETEGQREWRCEVTLASLRRNFMCKNAWRLCVINLNLMTNLYRENISPHSKLPVALILLEITSKCRISLSNAKCSTFYRKPQQSLIYTVLNVH